MRALDASTVLGLWERAEPLDPVGRTLALAAGVPGETAIEDIAALPLGERDALLLDLHESFAQSSLEGTAACAHCSELVEFSLPIQAIRNRGATHAERSPVEVEGIHIEWRPPTSQDLKAAAAAESEDAAEATLIERCLTPLDRDGEPMDVKELSPDARRAAADAIAAADPLAEIVVDLECPECGNSFTAELDVAEFAWSHLAQRARELLRDIDTLARAYGWSEPQVLALSEQRRTAYLRLIETAAS
jgi:hypothetical protein